MNQKRTCVIFYQLCFGYSKGNFFHEDNGLFLKFCNLSQNGIETQRQLGTSISSKEITKIKAAIADANFMCVTMQWKKPSTRILQFC